MNKNARITLIMTTTACLAILAIAVIINNTHCNENRALVIQCLIFAVYNIALNFALNSIRIVKRNAARKLVLIGKWSMPLASVVCLILQAEAFLGYGYRASLHSYGGTFDSVTCHQRRYHYARLRIVASSRAIGCIQRWCCSLCRRPFTSLPTDDPGAPAAWLPASRTYLLALFSFCEPPGSQKRTVTDALL